MQKKNIKKATTIGISSLLALSLIAPATLTPQFAGTGSIQTAEAKTVKTKTYSKGSTIRIYSNNIKASVTIKAPCKVKVTQKTSGRHATVTVKPVSKKSNVKITVKSGNTTMTTPVYKADGKVKKW